MHHTCSYVQAVLDPIADAIKGAMKPDTKAVCATCAAALTCLGWLWRLLRNFGAA